MTIQEKGIITLIKSAVTGEKLELPAEFSLDEAYKTLKAHSLLPLGYTGALQCGLPRNTPVMQKMFQKFCALTLISERQMKAVEQIYAAFDREKISYMPVKGCNIKGLYPAPQLRAMGDADILIRMEEYDRIRPIMQQLGYEEGEPYYHELPWSSKALNVELHRMLIPTYHPELYAYYGDGWKTAKIHRGTHYFMTDEDQYIYIFTHFTKHFQGGGVGLRQALDLWVYRRSYPQLDMDYVRQELKKLGLVTFHANMEKVLAAWFADGPWEPVSQTISDYIFNSGAWGTPEQIARWTEEKKAITAGESRISRGKWLRTALFPPIRTLAQRYPVVEKCPVLLPGVWVWRWFDAALFRRKNIAGYRSQMNALSRESENAHLQSMQAVGLGREKNREN